MKNNNNLDVNENVIFEADRDFGGLIGAPFYFLKQEFKPFSRAIFRYAGPFFAISMLCFSVFANDIYQLILSDSSDFIPSTFLYLGIFGFFLAIGFFMVIVIAHSYVTVYVRKGKYNFTVEEVWELAKRKFFPVFFSQILVSLMVIPAVLFFYIPGIYLWVSLSFVSIAIIYEDKSVGESISRSFNIVKGNWWFSFGIILLFGFIIGFASYVFIIPVYAISIFSAISRSLEISAFLGILISVILYFTAYLYFIALQQVLIGFLFFRIKFRREGMGLSDRIEAINKNNAINISEEKEEYESVIFQDKEIETKEKTDNEEKNRFLDDEKNSFKF